MRKALPATITEVPEQRNAWFYKIESDCGEVFNLRGPGAPKGANLGDRGSVQYQSNFSCGFYSWSDISPSL